MAKAKAPVKVKLFVGMLSSKDALFEEAAGILAGRFGRIDEKSPIFKFDYTDYYSEEMGAGLKRRFISFKRLIDPGRLIAIKRLACGIEARLAGGEGCRRINLDPGYITEAKLVLASAKDFQHRVYLGRGIYAEVTMKYAKGDFHPYEWTYRDYQSEEYKGFFRRLRSIYRQQLLGPRPRRSASRPMTQTCN